MLIRTQIIEKESLIRVKKKKKLHINTPGLEILTQYSPFGTRWAVYDIYDNSSPECVCVGVKLSVLHAIVYAHFVSCIYSYIECLINIYLQVERFVLEGQEQPGEQGLVQQSELNSVRNGQSSRLNVLLTTMTTGCTGCKD